MRITGGFREVSLGNVELELDGSGRINIPKRMMDFADLRRKWLLWGWEIGLRSGILISTKRILSVTIQSIQSWQRNIWLTTNKRCLNIMCR